MPAHRSRLLGWHDTNVYHVISRTTGRDFLLGPTEREMFARVLHKVARFCGVELLTWCCLSNHFHLLVRISDTDSSALRARLRADPEAFFRHLAILYDKRRIQELKAEWKLLRGERTTSTEAENEWVSRFLLRIGDLSVFVKELKQRYSIWFNSNHHRDGALWSAKYRSVLVENSPQALRTVACYIDLNPVRAGIVTDPKDYRWCGYSQALGGVKRAREGLQALLREDVRGIDPRKPSLPWRSAAEEYRLLLFGKAIELSEENRSNDGSRRDAKVWRKGTTVEEVKAVLETGGRLTPGLRFRLKMRHLSEGTALGSAEFLQDLLENRPQQVGPKRMTGARTIGSLNVEGFYSLRQLKEAKD